MKKLIRTLQTSFPALQEYRLSTERHFRKLLGRVHENDFNALSLFPDEAGAVYIDIGANRGQSIESILARRSKARIVSFEPNPYLFQNLVSRYASSSNVTIHNLGLGDAETRSVLHVPFYRKYMFDGLASLNRDEAAGWLKGGLYWYNEKLLSVKEITCHVKRLDDFRLNPYFIKIDTQGFEMKILTGAQKTLQAHTPILLIEDATPEITSFLSNFGYQSYRYENNAFATGYGSPNTFYIADDKFKKLRQGGK
ncbi:MAG: FkbM family methyltransferase [Cytophagales bacterium]|nr:FkbM family methyltransferase [Cytophagales bacterium]